jgi:hypothetical protein
VNRLLRNLSLLLISVVIGLVWFFPTSNAQQGIAEGNGFRISPVRQELVIEKGQSTTFVIALENVSSDPIRAQAIVNDFLPAADESGNPRLILDDQEDSPARSLKRLITQIPEIDLEPRQRKEISVTVSVPDDARTGGYYGAVRFAPTTGGGGVSNVNLTASVGTIVLLEVPGDVKKSLAIEEIGVVKDGRAGRFFTTGPINGLLRLKNDGDIHLKPFGKITLKKGDKIIEEKDFNLLEGTHVLPDSIRRYEIEFSKKQLFGRYTIEANIAFEQGSGTLPPAAVTFYVFPVWFLGLVILGLIGISLIVYVIVRRLRRR